MCCEPREIENESTQEKQNRIRPQSLDGLTLDVCGHIDQVMQIILQSAISTGFCSHHCNVILARCNLQYEGMKLKFLRVALQEKLLCAL